jgi:hypothetical protein
MFSGNWSSTVTDCFIILSLKMATILNFKMRENFKTLKLKGSPTYLNVHRNKQHNVGKITTWKYAT